MVVSILEITTPQGAIADKTQTKPTKFYNLDAIIAVGYRVNSNRAVLGNILRYANTFGSGFSEPNLRNMRKFYLVYSQILIQQKPSTELQNPNNVLDTIWEKPLAKLPHFTIGWSR